VVYSLVDTSHIPGWYSLVDTSHIPRCV